MGRPAHRARARGLRVSVRPSPRSSRQREPTKGGAMSAAAFDDVLDEPRAATVRTDIPRRLDRLPWSRWHWLVVLALGITWILDGFEVTIVGSIAAALTKKDTLHLTTQQSSSAGTYYLLGAVAGALFFGYLTDRIGRKKLFMVTLCVYLVFTVATALAWSYASFAVFRVLAGAGIGGEYAAINSAIDELIPARVRGRVALMINSSWWVGTAAAAGLSVVLLNTLPDEIGWRVGFLLGAILALGIITIRRFVPESPRWLLTHGRADEAEQVVQEVEEKVRHWTGKELPPVEGEPLEIEQRGHIGFVPIIKYVVREYPGRGVLGLTLMTGQAFFYNAIFFTYALVLSRFMGVDPDNAGLLPHPVRRRERARALAPRRALRLRRAAADDRGDVHRLGAPAARHRVDVHGGDAQRGHDDAHVVGHVLLRLVGRVGGVPHGERALPDGGARDGDRALLRRRNRDRSVVADPLRRADRVRIADERVLRLPARRRADGARRGRCARARRRRRAALAGGHRRSA